MDAIEHWKVWNISAFKVDLFWRCNYSHQLVMMNFITLESWKFDYETFLFCICVNFDCSYACTKSTWKCDRSLVYFARELAWKLENFAWKWPRHALHLQRALEKIWMHEPFFIYSTILIVDVKIIQGIEILSNKCKSKRADYFDTLMCFVRVSSFAFVFRFLARLALWRDCFSFLFLQFA